MVETDDIALLKQFAETDSEPAFAGIVSRHLNLVYSTALRATGNAHAAQEIAQAVFIILARKAKLLGAKTILSGWLHQTARLTAANHLRGEIRRQKREQETFMQSTLNEPDSEAWRQIAPILDDAISRLGAKDRDAIVLRFFENKSLGEVGAAMGASEDAAKMRVNRALEKLRKIFAKRGVSLTTAIIAGAVSANSVQAAPVGLAKTISAVAIAKGAAAGGSTLALVKGALKIMAWTKMKTTVVAGAAVLLAASVTPYIWYYHLAPDSWRHRLDAAYRLKHGEVLRYIPPPFIPERLKYYQTEDPMQAKAIPAGPDALVFFQDKQGKLNSGGYTFGSKQFTLSMQLRTELGFQPYEFEGPANLLNLTVNGDWTIRQGVSQDDLVKAMEPILWKATKHHIVFQNKTVERDVIVVTGNHFDVQWGTHIQLYAENSRDRGYEGYGDLKTFFQNVGSQMETRLIDETEINTNSPAYETTANLTWTYHRDSDARTMKNRRTELTDKVLKNLTDQTGLTFTREQRPVDVWFVSEQKSGN